jgi:serine/threonine-protein kinase
MVPIGAILAGKYRVDRVLGQGGMGVVVQAMHLQLRQPVAVKLLLPDAPRQSELVQRFMREAQAQARLRSEHVARVLDVGALDDGTPYMVLEYLDGTELGDESHQQLTVGEIVDLMRQACEALAEAHSLGIVHRDIKPDNLFVTRRADGSRFLKVLDFGISKIQQPTLEDRLTTTSAVMGTPAYMSPEHMKSARLVDHRSDIWALGAVLYELLDGAPPFIAESYPAMIVKVAIEPVPPLSGELPRGLAEVVYRCLEKDPAHRFQSVAELARALEPYMGSPARVSGPVERVRRLPRRLPLPLLAGAVGVLGAMIVAAVTLSRGADAPAGRAPTPAMLPISPTTAPAMPAPVPTPVPVPAPTAADAEAAQTEAAQTDAAIPGAPRGAPAAGDRPPPRSSRVSRERPPKPTGSLDLDGDGIPDRRRH